MTRTARTVRRGAAAVALIGATLALSAAGRTQPPAGDPKPAQGNEARTPGGAGQDRPITADAMRERLQRRLGEAKDNVKQLEDALDKLNRGVSAEEVRRMLPERGWRPDRAGGDWQGDRPPGGPGEPRPDRPLTDEEKQTVREILTAAFPQMLKTIDEMSAQNPEAAQRKLSEIRRLGFLLELKKRDPKMYSMRLEEIRTAREVWAGAGDVIDLRRQGIGADAPAMKAALTRLRGLVTAKVAARLAVVRHELEDLHKRVGDKQAEVDKLEKAMSEGECGIDKEMQSVLERAEKSPSGRGPAEDPLMPGRGKDRNRGEPPRREHDKPPPG